MTEAKQTGIIAKAQEKKPKQQPTITDYINAYRSQIEKALPSVMTADRFTRIVTSAVRSTPALTECEITSFLGAMMNAAQLGLEPNTPLGQAYLLPYKNKKKGILECQFQIGYRGLLTLADRTGRLKSRNAHIVYENDDFDFEYGLHADLKHKPTLGEKGKPVWVYAYYKLQDGGEAFEVMSWDDVMAHGKKYSQSFDSQYSPWQTNPDEMAKKTLLKRVLKYAPLSSEFVREINTDQQTFEFDPLAKKPELVLNPKTGEVIESEKAEDGEAKNE